MSTGINRKQFLSLAAAIAASSSPTVGGCSSNYQVGVDGGVDAGSDSSQDGGNDAAMCQAAPGGGTCTVFPPCGCSAAQNCARINGAPEVCVANGKWSQLQNCISTADCQHGLVCAHGVCERPCATNGDCANNYVCFAQLGPAAEGVTPPPLGYNACEPHCNPVYPSTNDATHVGCGASQRCQMVYDALGGTYCVYPTGGLGQGASCASSTDCKAGYDCLFTTAWTCLQYCRVGQFDCLTGTCGPTNPPAYDRNTQIGVCQ